MFTAFNMEDPCLQAATYTWRSPKWQRLNGGKGLTPAIRPALNGKPSSLDVAASEKAWWNMPATTLQRYGKDLGADMPDTSDLFPTLMKFEQHVLEKSDDDILERTHHRFVNFDSKLQTWEVVQGVYEAISLLDRDDQERLGDQIKQCGQAVEDRAVFKKAFVEKHSEVAKTKRQRRSQIPSQIINPIHLRPQQRRRRRRSGHLRSRLTQRRRVNLLPHMYGEALLVASGGATALLTRESRLAFRASKAKP